MKRELTDARFVNIATSLPTISSTWAVGSARVGTGAKTGRGYNAGFISAGLQGESVAKRQDRRSDEAGDRDEEKRLLPTDCYYYYDVLAVGWSK